MLKQTAIYWAPGPGLGLDDFGQPTYSEPIDIKVRWEDVQEEFLDAQGERQVSHSKVYVGQDVVLKGMLKLGSVEDSDVDKDYPNKNEGAWEIRSFNKIPDLKGKKFLRIAYL